MWDANPLLLGEEDPSQWLVATWGGGFGETISLPRILILMWPFYPSCGVAVQLALRFFSEGIVLYIAVDFIVSVGGSEFKIFLCCHLELPPVFLLSFESF